MLTKEELAAAKPQQLRWQGAYLSFKGHYLIQILIQCDKNGKPGNYVPIYTVNSNMPISIHHALANPNFEMLKRLSKDHLVSYYKDLKSRGKL